VLDSLNFPNYFMNGNECMLLLRFSRVVASVGEGVVAFHLPAVTKTKQQE
jgi:hypothetical protein